MEETVYVVSEPVNLKKIFSIISVVIVILFLLINIGATGMNPLIMLFDGYSLFEVISVLVLTVLGAISSSLVFIWILFLIQRFFSKYSMVVTDKRVYGTAAFGRRVDLPFDSITAVSTGWFSGICVSTASGVIRFYCLKNSNIIYDTLNALLIYRQNNQVVQQPVVQVQETPVQFDPTEEIRKYKALLDDGIITKKEFEDKKKELLNLK